MNLSSHLKTPTRINHWPGYLHFAAWFMLQLLFQSGRLKQTIKLKVTFPFPWSFFFFHLCTIDSLTFRRDGHAVFILMLSYVTNTAKGVRKMNADRRKADEWSALHTGGPAGQPANMFLHKNRSAASRRQRFIRLSPLTDVCVCSKMGSGRPESIRHPETAPCGAVQCIAVHSSSLRLAKAPEWIKQFTRIRVVISIYYC